MGRIAREDFSDALKKAFGDPPERDLEAENAALAQQVEELRDEMHSASLRHETQQIRAETAERKLAEMRVALTEARKLFSYIAPFMKDDETQYEIVEWCAKVGKMAEAERVLAEREGHAESSEGEK